MAKNVANKVSPKLKGIGNKITTKIKSSIKSNKTPCGKLIGCFTAGTLIPTEDGYRPIEEIEIGDYVWSENPYTGEVELKQVVNTFIYEKDTLVILRVNGETIETTKEHPFYVENIGRVSAKNLEVGDVLRLIDGSNAKLESIEIKELDEIINVYNFEVEDFHTYFVGENCVLVHNDCDTSCFEHKKRISLASSKKVKIDMDEVITGHTSTGYRAKQSQLKYLFPDRMSPKAIDREIRLAYSNSKQIGKPQFDGINTRVKLQGRGKNGVVEMWYNNDTKVIETAYPIYGKKVKISW